MVDTPNFPQNRRMVFGKIYSEKMDWSLPALFPKKGREARARFQQIPRREFQQIPRREKRGKRRTDSKKKKRGAASGKNEKAGKEERRAFRRSGQPIFIN